MAILADCRWDTNLYSNYLQEITTQSVRVKSLMTLVYCGWLARDANDFQKLPVTLGAWISWPNASSLCKMELILYIFELCKSFCHDPLHFSWFKIHLRVSEKHFSIDHTNPCLRGNVTPFRPPESCWNISSLVLTNCNISYSYSCGIPITSFSI